MFDYNYTRDLVNGKFNIENELRVDGEGNHIYLFHEIKAIIPDNKFTIECNNTNVTISFEQELTSEQQTLLDTVVANHKNNT